MLTLRLAAAFVMALACAPALAGTLPGVIPVAPIEGKLVSVNQAPWDFNGDGTSDLLKLWEDAGGMTVDVHASSGSAFDMVRFGTRQGMIWSAQRWVYGDFNGDGKLDLAKLWNDAGAMTVDVHVSTGSGFTMSRWATRQGGYWDQQKWYAGDFNGDGKTDLAKLWNDNGTMTIDVHVSTGSSFTMQRWATNQGGIWEDQRWIAGDFNADGKLDLAKFWIDAGAMTIDVHLSTGSAFTKQRWATRQGSMWKEQQWLTGDFNGDGKTDLAKYWNDAGYLTMDVHVSTGSGFTMSRWATRQGMYWDQLRFVTGDFNGDGKLDFAKFWEDAGAMTVDLHLSTGSAFAMARWATRQGSMWSQQTWMVGDFNGDGKADLLKFWNDAGAMTADAHLSTGSGFTMSRWATRQGMMWNGQYWLGGVSQEAAVPVQSTCSTACMGECGADCNGVLGTHCSSSACLSHDQCVIDHGCNRFAIECTLSFIAAGTSWVACAAQTIWNAVVNFFEGIVNTFCNWFGC